MSHAPLSQRLQTVVAVTLSPFDDRGRLDVAAIEANIAYLVEAGMTAVVTAGNTGEFYALSASEHESLMRVTVEALTPSPDVVAVAGVGHDVKSAIEQAECAARLGADVVMVHSPPHPHVSEDGLVQYFGAIAHGSPLPVVPYLSKPVLTAAGVQALIETVDPPAIKYGLRDLPRFRRDVSAGGQGLAWICGTAELWAPFFWPAGATGFTSGLANVHPRISLDLLASLRTGDWQRTWSLWDAVHSFETLRSLDGDVFNVAAVKEAVAQAGRPAGSVRPPASALPAGLLPHLRQAVADMVAVLSSSTDPDGKPPTST